MKYRIPALVAALALAALAIPLIAGVASAAPTTLQPAQFENSTPSPTPCATPTFPSIFRPRPTPVRSPDNVVGALPAAIQLVTPSPTACYTPTIPPTTPPTATPAQSEQGQTASTVTPPPTSTGSNGSSNSSMPLFALLICGAFGGLALAAVTTQRRTIRR